MASDTIVAPLPDAVIAQHRQDLLDGYERFRAIIDGYAEEPRPSIHDVQAVAGTLRDAVAATVGQNAFSVAPAPFVGRRMLWNSKRKGQRRVSTMQSPISSMSGQDISEGRSFRLRLSPGVVGLRSFDANKAEKTAERAKAAAESGVDLAVGVGEFEEDFTPDAVKPGKGEIVCWSRRSRERMSEYVSSLDFSEWLQRDGALAMVTLTIPALTRETWLAVAPDGKTYKKLLKRFELRWRRNIGPWVCLWKLEFTRRGAPHWHALLRVPALVGALTFEEWLSETWADCVGHPDPAERAKHVKAGTGVDFSGRDFSDPRRIALYFMGHSAKSVDGKEYQNIVPEEWQQPGKGPGRFWGYAGLSKAVVEIELTERDSDRAARILRKVRKARAWKTAVLREKGKLEPAARKNFSAFSVEKLPKPKIEGRRGRSAHRTYNMAQWAKAAETGAPWRYQSRIVFGSLGAGGYAVGGWVLVNDGLQLALDLARYFRADTSPAAGTDYDQHDVGAIARNLPSAVPGQHPHGRHALAILEHRRGVFTRDNLR